MLKRLWKALKSMLTLGSPKTGSPKTASNVKAGDVVGNVTIGYIGLKPSEFRTKEDIDRMRQAQLDKHTDFKVGESYRLGEAIVTLHPNKASMLRAIAAVDAKREAKVKRLTKRAEDIMLMTPDQITELQLNEWLEKRSRVMSKIQKILALPTIKPPSGKKDDRTKEAFDKIVHDNALDVIDEAKKKDPVH